MAIKTKNPNTKNAKQPNKHQPYFEDYFNYRTWRQVPVSDAFLEERARQLVEWVHEAKNGDIKTCKISQFRHLYGIPLLSWHRWCKRSQVLADANSYAQAVIGDRREEKMLTREWSEKAVAFTLHQYDPAWGEANRDHAELRKIGQDSGNTAPTTLNVIKNLDRGDDEETTVPKQLQPAVD